MNHQRSRSTPLKVEEPLAQLLAAVGRQAERALHLTLTGGVGPGERFSS
jgi:hypothetical protein